MKTKKFFSLFQATAVAAVAAAAAAAPLLPPTGADRSPNVAGTSSPGTNSRFAPSLVMHTVRMHPPLDPSRAIACATALRTKATHSSALIPGRHSLSQRPVM